MGLFGRNATSLGGHYDVVANENYRGVDGALVALTEGYVNDQAIFEAVIGQDFAEAYAFSEGCELEIVTESGLGGAFDKLKAFIKKIWEKIKGLLHSFIVKLNKVVITDNKKFVEKYKNDVLKKNLSKMKYKWCEPDNSKISGLASRISSSNIDTVLSGASNVFTMDEKKLQVVNDNIDDGTKEDEVLTLLAGVTTDSSSFTKDVHEECFDSETEEEGLDSSRLTDIMSTLVGSKKEIENVKKAQDNIDKVFKSLLNSIDKAQKDIMKKIPKEANKKADAYTISYTHKDDNETRNIEVKDKDRDTYVDGNNGRTYSYSNHDIGSNTLNNQRLSVAHRMASLYNTCFTRTCSALMAETKFKIKQARTVFAKAAAYRATNESMYSDYVYLDAVAESAGFEIESAFEDYEY